MRHDLVWVILDRLTKLTYFLQDRVDYSSKQLAKIYIKEILKLHRVPISSNSDRGMKFTSMFFHNLHGELGTKPYSVLVFILRLVDSKRKIFKCLYIFLGTVWLTLVVIGISSFYCVSFHTIVVTILEWHGSIWSTL